MHLVQDPSTTEWDPVGQTPTTVGQAWQQQAALDQVPTTVGQVPSSSTVDQVPTMAHLAHHPHRDTTLGPPTLERGVAAVVGGVAGGQARTLVNPTPHMGVRVQGVTHAVAGEVSRLQDHTVDPMHQQVGVNTPSVWF